MPKESAARDRILQTASRLFYQQGYTSTGINQIVAEADIAIATLYKHFPSKKDLLHAYVDQQDETWFGQLEAFLSNIKGGPREKILGLFDFRIQWGVGSAFRGCPFVKVSAEVSIDEQQVFHQVGRHKAKVKAYLTEWVAQLPPKQGRMSLDMLAETLYLLMEGAGVTNLIHQNKAAMNQARAIAEALI